MSSTTTKPSGILAPEDESAAPPDPTSQAIAASAARHLAASSPTRRGAIFAATAGLLATAAACEVKIDPPKDPAGPSPKPSVDPTKPGATPTGSTPPAPVSGDPGTLRLPKDLDQMLLINRTTYGATPELIAEVKKRGAQAWLAEQLTPEKIADPDGDAVLKSFPQAGFTAAIVRKENPVGASGDDHIGGGYPDATRKAHTGRALLSKRQVKERMLDFWIDHFNVTQRGTGTIRVTRPDLDVRMRELTFGKFSDMLTMVSEHAAMLSYLNGAENTVKHPNENFAREIMELHTVGIDGGYTEDDVAQAAYLLTGWATSRHDPPAPEERFQSRFSPQTHGLGPVKIMGFRSENAKPEDGLQAQRDFYSYLARHPKTAQRISSKLATVFVSDEPPASLVDRMAKVYLDSDTEVVPVLCELFSSPEFAASAGKKTRRPREYILAVLRAMGAKHGSDDINFASELAKINSYNPSQEPFSWLTPDGFPLTADLWTSPGISLEMFNTCCQYLRVSQPGLALPGETKLVSSSVTTVDGATAELTKKWFGRAPLPTEITAARILVTKSKMPEKFTSDADRAKVAGAVGVLLMQSPSMLTS